MHHLLFLLPLDQQQIQHQQLFNPSSQVLALEEPKQAEQPNRSESHVIM